MAEKACVELIDVFINFTDVKPVDEKNNRVFGLPLSEINESNWRTELKMPTDKYDWLSFEKVFHPVFIHPKSEKEKLCLYLRRFLLLLIDHH